MDEEQWLHESHPHPRELDEALQTLLLPQAIAAHWAARQLTGTDRSAAWRMVQSLSARTVVSAAWHASSGSAAQIGAAKSG